MLRRTDRDPLHGEPSANALRSRSRRANCRAARTTTLSRERRLLADRPSSVACGARTETERGGCSLGLSLSAREVAGGRRSDVVVAGRNAVRDHDPSVVAPVLSRDQGAERDPLAPLVLRGFEKEIDTRFGARGAVALDPAVHAETRSTARFAPMNLQANR